MSSPVKYHPLALEPPTRSPRASPAGVPDDDSWAGGLCGGDSDQPGGLWYAESLDLSNDPRFLGETVLDKRLAAFTTLSMVASISTAAVCDNFFPFVDSSDIKIIGTKNPWDLVRSCMQLVGFVCMSIVLFLDVTATIVFGAQFYFAYKLMTSGPVGFESARGFYKDAKMTEYRSRAASGLILGQPLFILSIGCMLYVKFDIVERDNKFIHHFACLLVFASFSFMAFSVFRISMDIQRTFSQKCRLSSQVTPLLQSLESDASSPRSWPW